MDTKKFIQLIEEKKEAPLKWEQKLEGAKANAKKLKAAKHKRSVSDSDTESDSDEKHKKHSHSDSGDSEKRNDSYSLYYRSTREYRRYAHADSGLCCSRRHRHHRRQIYCLSSDDSTSEDGIGLQWTMRGRHHHRHERSRRSYNICSFSLDSKHPHHHHSGEKASIQWFNPDRWKTRRHRR